MRAADHELSGAEVVALADAAVEPARLVLLRGDINFTNAPAVERRIAALALEAGAVIVDLSSVRYLDSSGLNLLLRQARAAEARGAQLVVVRGDVALFRLEAVERALVVAPSRAAALALLRGSPGSAPAPTASPARGSPPTPAA